MAETFSVFIDPSYTADERRAIGRAIVTYITTRTRRGRGVGNIPFTNRSGAKEYSKAYQEHPDFKVTGKGRRPINLTLTGEMLDSVEVLDISLAGRIIVGIADDGVAVKARWMREKGYNFLGLTTEEQNTILARFSKLTPQQIQVANLVEDVADNFLRNINDG